jgi:hypothetical protein
MIESKEESEQLKKQLMEVNEENYGLNREINEIKV